MASKSTVSHDADLYRFLRKCNLESRAICRYLEEKYRGKGTELVPAKDIKGRFLVEQAAYIEAFNFNPSASGMVFEKVFKK